MLEKSYFLDVKVQLLLLRITGLFFAMGLFSSCTALQWRQTDAEITKSYAEKGVKTQITYLQIDSLDLAVRVVKVGTGAKDCNMLFFHGSPSSLSAWNGYMTDSILYKRAQLYVVDRPGYGYSNFGDELTSIDTQARIMSTLIDTYDLKNVIAVGASYGGPLAAHLAVLNEKVKAVVMVSPAIDPENEKDIWASRLTQWWITRWLVPTGYRVAGDEKTVHASELKKIEGGWPSLQVPVIHIHGNIDDIVPYENVSYTAKVFPNIKIVTTEDTGHEIAWARKDLILPHLLELIHTLGTSLEE